MFNNVGKKLMSAAKVIAGIIIAIYVIIAIVTLFSTSHTSVFGGLIVATLTVLLGCLVAWLSAVGIYAFGQMVDDVHAMRGKVVGDIPQQPYYNQPAPQYYQQPVPPQNGGNNQYPTNNL